MWIQGKRVMKILPIAALSVIAIVGSAMPARAELAFFQSGRTMSIKEHHMDGASLVLTLRNGGQIVCEPSTISRFVADEVPYPEPEPEPAPIVAEVLTPVPYGEIIDKVSAEHGVPAKLVRAVIQVESAYQQRARSRKGAMGLMQLMPDTARQYGVSNPYDPASNIEAGIKHLKALTQKLPLALALAAYNAGEAAVERFHGVPPYPETQAYVGRIMRMIGQ
jgi:soluble lytic murein transglycosylase-like protein